MNGDIENALAEITSKQKQPFKTALSNSRNFQEYLIELKKEIGGQKNEEEELRKAVIKIIQKYGGKNEKLCL